jgi:small nuclear ribonucleoprotein (snRNP)-like protein
VLLAGCAHYSPIEYREIEKTNRVAIVLQSGATVRGTVQRVEPHQVLLVTDSRETVQIQKSSIRGIRRKSPVRDDFGQGISEEEIHSVKTSRNTAVYGIGGGLLSFGASFFAGSLLGHASESGGTVLVATAASGTLIGTVLFVRTGRNQDRKTAIEEIREIRRTADVSVPAETKPATEVQHMLDVEKQKQDELRKQREDLLRQLDQPPKQP